MSKTELHYIYLLKENTEFNNYKIGISIKPFNRAKDINTSNPNGVHVFFAYPIGSQELAFEVERYLHGKFKNKRKHGEWFKLEDVDVLGISAYVCHKSLARVKHPMFQEKVVYENNKIMRNITDKELLIKAKEVVFHERRASASLLQRKLSVGYARAARLLDMLQLEGIISSPNGSHAREVFMSKD